MPCTQAGAKAAAEGKSAVTGVYYDAKLAKWVVRTPQPRGSKSWYLAAVSSQAEAEALAAACLPHVLAAAAEGRISDEVAAVKASLFVEV